MSSKTEQLIFIWKLHSEEKSTQKKNVFYRIIMNVPFNIFVEIIFVLINICLPHHKWWEELAYFYVHLPPVSYFLFLVLKFSHLENELDQVSWQVLFWPWLEITTLGILMSVSRTAAHYIKTISHFSQAFTKKV